MTAKLYIEPRLDVLIHKDFYGYRPINPQSTQWAKQESGAGNITI